ncbi:copper homeostasis protein CutC [Cohnella nanjingensis]|uniref:PF03932 family protein CutC n=1 Tax=Cohnella nanjingensis TaxID=1387779 RepID=A0A7X0RQT0_9BACL|nr:copper homeostasis protein CutC [Cohnella nanjingensis]MBB6671997.1 copper homeostasis protein CutC [Cohnella nanjingensis]
MKLEVIATCIEDALIAEENGADRLELITAITEGGLTPGIGLVEQVAKTVRIPVHVIVRPHSRSFVYSKLDLLTMAAETKAIAASGAAGIVVGALTAEGRIDEQALEVLLPLTNGLQVTFHKAFDELDDQIAGLRTLRQYPEITRVLTSAGPGPASEAAGAIRRLVEEAGHGSPQILAGGGMKLEGIRDFIETSGVREVHFGTAVRQGRDALAPIDPAALRALAGSLRSAGTLK